MKLDGYSNYEIDVTSGTVFNIRSKKFIGTKDEKGYIKCTLHKDTGGYKTFKIHRLVWTVVNGEIPNGMEINHIDENKENNSITNLNLMTHRENCNWGKNTKKTSIPVVLINNTKIIKFYTSMKDAERNGCNRGTIQRHLNKTSHSKKYWTTLENQLADWLEEIQDEDMKKERVA